MKFYSDSATITGSGNEEIIEFNHAHNFFHVQNLGSGTVKISSTPNIIGRTDGVIDIPSGGSASISNGKDGNLYLYGNGKINIITNDSAFNPFRNAGQGGGGGGTGGTDDYNDLINQPKVNGITLFDNKSLEDLGFYNVSDESIEDMFARIKGVELETLGDAAHFDATSIDVASGVWNNILNPEKNILISSGVNVNKDEVVFPYNEYGVYTTDPLYTIYAVFKSNSDKSSAVINKRKMLDQPYTSFDINASGGNSINLIGGSNNITSGIPSLNTYHVVCIVRGGSGLGYLYIDGNFIGSTNYGLIDTNYYGTYLINQRIIYGSTVYERGDNTYKAVVFDTASHPEDVILRNMRYLRLKYLGGG